MFLISSLVQRHRNTHQNNTTGINKSHTSVCGWQIRTTVRVHIFMTTSSRKFIVPRAAEHVPLTSK